MTRGRQAHVDGKNSEVMDGPEMTKNLCAAEKSRVGERDTKPEHCTMRWENLQQFWSRTDIIISEIIAHTKKAPTIQANLKLDGNMMDEIREGWNSLLELPSIAHN